MLWVLNRIVSIKLMGKEISTVLHSKFVLAYIYVYMYCVLKMQNNRTIPIFIESGE